MANTPLDPAGPAAFPAETAWSAVLAARDRASPEWKNRVERLIGAYWQPVRWFLVRHWNCTPEDADDLAQEFFARLCEEDFLQNASPERGRFRTFLKLKLRDLVIDELRRRKAEKRGGGAKFVPITAEAGGIPELSWPGLPPDEAFDRVWANSLLALSLEDLRRRMAAEGRGPIFEAFYRCTVEVPPLAAKECAEALGLKERDVRNYVFRTRRELQRILYLRVRDSVEREGEAEDELAAVLRHLGV